MPGIDRIERLWTGIQDSARQQGRSVFLVSSAIAVSTVAHVPANLLWLSRAARSAARRTGQLVGEAILDHYAEAITEMARTGFVEYWAREFRPYLRAAAAQFAPAHASLTERLFE
jgi:hypothetical protein